MLHVPRSVVSFALRRGLSAAIALLGMVSAIPPGTAVAADQPYRIVWEWATPGVLPQAICPERRGTRNLLYVALKQGGLAILADTNRPAGPETLARIGRDQLGGLDVMQLALQEGKLYLALGDFFGTKGDHAGLAVVDVARPERPRVLGHWKSPEVLQGGAAVIVVGQHAFLGGMHHGVIVLDVGDPAAIRHVTTFLPDPNFPKANPTRVQRPNVRGFAVKENALFVAFDAGGLRVLDISDPTAPQEIGRHLNPGMADKQQAYNNLSVDGDLAYVAIDYAGLEILDIRDPRKIRRLGWWNPWEAQTAGNLWFNSGGHTNQIAYDPDRKEVHLSAGDSELLTVNVSRPAEPRLAGSYGGARDKLGAWGLALGPDRIYLAYIQAFVPFQGQWSGIKAVER